MKNNRKKMILTAAALTALALFAGCTNASAVSLEEARDLAYAHAGISESDAYDRSYERDDGIYEIDFDCDGWEYAYCISRTGEILHTHREHDDDHHTHQKHHTQPTEPQSGRIGGEEAFAIALGHAGISDVFDRDVEWDDGRWEVSFQSGRTEYDYDISADGAILRWEREIDD